MKLVDREWMVWKVLGQDPVQTDAEPQKFQLQKDHLARTWGNLMRALVFGYRVRYRVLPDGSGSHDVNYTMYRPGVSYGFNEPPGLEAKKGKVVHEYYNFERWGKVRRSSA